ncbi:hypothetical protein AB0G74_28080 [Streptomyces sp. NPDC020875]|uniref:hypothetical protein n=1 Tax=Streptomyces sp. NPDC020875 TaxID=3154898 RepID=UPI0033C4871A
MAYGAGRALQWGHDAEGHRAAGDESKEEVRVMTVTVLRAVRDQTSINSTSVVTG